jgi:sucrose-6-phosphate hydrolase SacC (GH32 family)
VGSARTYIGSLDRYRLRLFLDKGCLEVYVNEGLAALYSPVAADPKDQGIALVGRAGVKPTSLGAWPLRPAKFNLDRFKI